MLATLTTQPRSGCWLGQTPLITGALTGWPSGTRASSIRLAILSIVSAYSRIARGHPSGASRTMHADRITLERRYGTWALTAPVDYPLLCAFRLLRLKTVVRDGVGRAASRSSKSPSLNLLQLPYETVTPKNSNEPVVVFSPPSVQSAFSKLLNSKIAPFVPLPLKSSNSNPSQ